VWTVRYVVYSSQEQSNPFALGDIYDARGQPDAFYRPELTFAPLRYQIEKGIIFSAVALFILGAG